MVYLFCLCVILYYFYNLTKTYVNIKKKLSRDYFDTKKIREEILKDKQLKEVIDDFIIMFIMTIMFLIIYSNVK